MLAVAWVFLGAAPIQAQQQDPYGDNSDEWWTRLEQQLTQSINSPNRNIRIRALQDLFYFTTNHPERVDFREAIPGLMDMYAWEKQQQYRVLALMTLQNVADEATMNRLHEMVKSETSPYVRDVTLAALAEHRRML
jgi:hypothetical protein